MPYLLRANVFAQSSGACDVLQHPDQNCEIYVQDLTCIQLLPTLQELEQMGRVDEIPIHTEASAINHAADTDRCGVHMKRFADSR